MSQVLSGPDEAGVVRYFDVDQLLAPGLAAADYFDVAAARHGVDPWIRRAIVF